MPFMLEVEDNAMRKIDNFEELNEMEEGSVNDGVQKTKNETLDDFKKPPTEKNAASSKNVLS